MYLQIYSPQRPLDQQALLWHIKFFVKKCMTIDTRDVSNLGPPKFRIGTKNGKEQVCYYNRNKKDKVYNKFLAIRKETSANKIIFSIEKLIDDSNNTENIFYKIDGEQKEFDNDRGKFKRPIRGTGTSDIAGTTGQQQVSKKPKFLSG